MVLSLCVAMDCAIGRRRGGAAASRVPGSGGSKMRVTKLEFRDQAPLATAGPHSDRRGRQGRPLRAQFGGATNSGRDDHDPGPIPRTRPPHTAGRPPGVSDLCGTSTTRPMSIRSGRRGPRGCAMQVPRGTVPAQSSTRGGASPATASGARRHIPGRRGTWPSNVNWAALVAGGSKTHAEPAQRPDRR